MSRGRDRIREAFRRAREEGRAALIPFLTAGDPDAATTFALVLEMARRGADIVELGIPFSDPLADGATIQRASQRALAGGFSLARGLELAARIRRASAVPIVFMSYANPLLNYGPTPFADTAAGVGVDGVIVPDLPPEEAGDLRGACDRSGLATIFLVAPTTSSRRLALICAASRGYVYYVARRGVTGTRDALPADMAAGIARVRAATDLPVAVGFGIARTEHVAAAAQEADGVIVGSAIVQTIEAHRERADLVERVAGFVAALHAATVRPAGAERR